MSSHHAQDLGLGLDVCFFVIYYVPTKMLKPCLILSIYVGLEKRLQKHKGNKLLLMNFIFESILFTMFFYKLFCLTKAFGFHFLEIGLKLRTVQKFVFEKIGLYYHYLVNILTCIDSLFKNLSHEIPKLNNLFVFLRLLICYWLSIKHDIVQKQIKNLPLGHLVQIGFICKFFLNYLLKNSRILLFFFYCNIAVEYEIKT